MDAIIDFFGSSNTSLSILRLLLHEISSSKILKLATSLRDNTSLTELELHLDYPEHCLREEDILVFINSLGSNSTLASLTLAHNQIGEAGISALMRRESLTDLKINGQSP